MKLFVFARCVFSRLGFGLRLMFALSLGQSQAFALIFPADTNADGRISQAELTAHLEAWHAGAPWVPGPSPIPDEYAEQATFLWQQGEFYRHEPSLPGAIAFLPDLPGRPPFVAAVPRSGPPGSFVELLGLPEDVGEVAVEIYRSGTTDVTYLALTEGPDETRGFLLPMVFPLNEVHALTARLIDREENALFEVGLLHLEPLAITAGAAQSAAADLDRLFSLTEQLFGARFDDFRTTSVEDFDETAAPLYLLERIFRSPDNPNNFQALMAGNAPIADELPDGLLDAFWTVSSLASGFREVADALQEILDDMTPLGALGTLSTGDVYHTHAPLIETLPNLDEIPDAATLASLMNIHHRISTFLEGSGKKVSDALSVGESLFSFLGPEAAVAANSVGGPVFIYQKYLEVLKGMLPGPAWQLRFEPTRLDFFADECEPARWEFWATPMSSGHVLDGAIIEAILKVTPALDKATSDKKFQMQSVFDRFEGLSPATRNLMASIAGLAADKEVPKMGEAFENFTIPARAWPEVDISEKPFTDAAVVALEPVIVLDPADHQVYEPVGTGSALLRVMTNGFWYTATGTAMINIEPGAIYLDIEDLNVEKDDIVVFTATVEHVRNQGITWQVSAGEIVNIGDNGPVSTLVWRSPSDDSAYPVLITAVMDTELCVLAGDNLSASAIVRHDDPDLFLTVYEACLEDGETLVITAFTSNFFETPDVTWVLVGPGTLFANGATAVYTAPDPASGEALITAYLTENPLTQAFCEVDLGDCGQGDQVQIFTAIQNGQVTSRSAALWSGTVTLPGGFEVPKSYLGSVRSHFTIDENTFEATTAGMFFGILPVDMNDGVSVLAASDCEPFELINPSTLRVRFEAPEDDDASYVWSFTGSGSSNGNVFIADLSLSNGSVQRLSVVVSYPSFPDWPDEELMIDIEVVSLTGSMAGEFTQPGGVFLVGPDAPPAFFQATGALSRTFNSPRMYISGFSPDGDCPGAFLLDYTF